jgi:hypothetical protein
MGQSIINHLTFYLEVVEWRYEIEIQRVELQTSVLGW